VVFGSDFAPVPAIPPVIANIQAAVTDNAQAQAVFSGNARALLSRFRIPALAQPALASA
jgi:predicted TIM-barrel fold metal-dependent hydrolase